MSSGSDEAAPPDDPRYLRLKAERDELIQRIALLEGRPRARDGSSPDPASPEQPLSHELTALVSETIPALREALPAGTTINAARLIESFTTLILLMRMLETTILTQIGALSRYNPRILEMYENLDRQKLLDIDAMIVRALTASSPRAPLLRKYCELVLRWASAILAGSHGTILDVGNSLRDALNYEKWPVTKGGFFKTEESIYWSYFREQLRPNLPLSFEDEVKRKCGHNTFEAYTALRISLGDAGRPASGTGAAPFAAPLWDGGKAGGAAPLGDSRATGE